MVRAGRPQANAAASAAPSPKVTPAAAQPKSACRAAEKPRAGAGKAGPTDKLAK